MVGQCTMHQVVIMPMTPSGTVWIGEGGEGRGGRRSVLNCSWSPTLLTLPGQKNLPSRSLLRLIQPITRMHVRIELG